MRPWMVGAVAVAGALLGLLAGVVNLSSSSETSEAGVPDNSQEANALTSGEEYLTSRTRRGNLYNNQAEIQTAIERADQNLIEENPSKALEILASLLESGLDDDMLLLRRAVANEELGNLETASSGFRSLAERTGNPVLRDAAQVSLARVLMQSGQLEDATEILAAFLARSDLSTSATTTAEATHLFAGLRPWTVHGKSETRKSDLASSGWQPSTRRIIVAAEAMPTPIAPSDSFTPIKLVSEFGSRADGFQLAVHKKHVKVAELIKVAAETSKLPVTISKNATTILAARHVTLWRTNISLSAMLDLLTLPYGLIWRQTEQSLEILSPSETTDTELSEVHLAIAIRTLRSALSTWPSHELAQVTWIRLASLQAEAGNMDSSLSLYTQFLREHPKSPLTATAWFNKAHVETVLGNTEAALASLYDLIDGFAGSQLVARSWLKIGGLLLRAERIDECVRPLVRASTTARSRDIQARAANALASAYLMSGKDSAASLVLMDFRDAVREAPHDRVSAMLGTLARFRVASGVRKEGEGQRLISALAQITDRDLEDDSIRFLTGQAWKELGLQEQMALIYQRSGESATGSRLRQRMLYEVGEWLRLSGESNEALRHFDQLDSDQESQWRRRGAESRLRILLSDGKLKLCIKGTGELLPTAVDDQEKRRLLELLGQAYESQGNYKVAAQCYSGVIPGYSGVIPGDPGADLRNTTTGRTGSE